MIGTWFRILTKKVLKPGESNTPRGKDYRWYEMGFFTHWEGPNVCRALCIGIPLNLRWKLISLLGDEVRCLALDSLEETDGNIGREDFAVSWRIFEHLVKSKKDAAEAEKDAAEAKKEAATAKEALSVDKARLQRL